MRDGRSISLFRVVCAVLSTALGLFVIWLGPELTNFYLHPVWQGALTGALVVGVLGMMGRLWSLVVVAVITALLLALPAWLSLEYRHVRATAPNGVSLFVGSSGEWSSLRLDEPGLLGRVCWVATVETYDIDQGSITWQNGRFIARDERGTVLADVPDHCE